MLLTDELQEIVIVALGEAVVEADRVTELDDVAVPVVDAVCDELDDADPLAEGLPEIDSLCEAEADEVHETDDEVDHVCVEETDAVVDADVEAVSDWLRETDVVTVCEYDALDDVVWVLESDGVPDNEPEGDEETEVLTECESDRDVDGVAEVEADGEPVRDMLPLWVSESEAVFDSVTLPLTVLDTEGDFDAEAESDEEPEAVLVVDGV